MTMEAMTSFLAKAESEPALAERLVEIVEENEAEAIYVKVASLATEHGFAVTAADSREAHKQFQAAMGGAEGELSDTDLENVAGGIGPGAVALIGAGGAIGAAGIGAGGAVGAAGIGGGAAIGAAVIKNGVNKTVDDVGRFFSRW